MEKIKKEIEIFVPVWKGKYNDTTDTLFNIILEIKGAKNQYEEFKNLFTNYYKTLKEDSDYIYEYLAFYIQYKDGKKLLDYAIKDIAKYLK